jgi:hypothetical protein
VTAEVLVADVPSCYVLGAELFLVGSTSCSTSNAKEYSAGVTPRENARWTADRARMSLRPRTVHVNHKLYA